MLALPSSSPSPVAFVAVVVTAAVAAVPALSSSGDIFRARPARYADAAIHCADHRCLVDRVRVRRLLESQTGLTGSARFVPTFRHGGMDGVRLYALRPASLLARLGLRNGDRILGINGSPLGSPERAIGLYRELRTASRIDVDLERAGAPTRLTYLIR